MVSNVLEGGCQCRQLRYGIRNPHPIVYACHCRECQKQSASAFGLTKPVRKADFKPNGELAVYTRPADSGGSTRCHFCPECGTRIFHEDSRSAGMISIKAGTLDPHAGERIAAHLWTIRKRPWVHLDGDAEVYETQPDDLAEWRRRLIESQAR